MRRTCIAFVLAAGASLAAGAQQPVFRSGIQYVTVDVIVTDKGEIGRAHV